MDATTANVATVAGGIGVNDKYRFGDIATADESTNDNATDVAANVDATDAATNGSAFVDTNAIVNASNGSSINANYGTAGINGTTCINGTARNDVSAIDDDSNVEQLWSSSSSCPVNVAVSSNDAISSSRSAANVAIEPARYDSAQLQAGVATKQTGSTATKYKPKLIQTRVQK